MYQGTNVRFKERNAFSGKLRRSSSLPKPSRLAAAYALIPFSLLALPAWADAGTATDNPAETQSQTRKERQDETVALPTVIVTAEKRETALRDTPLSVSAVGADEIERQGLETLKELMGQVPGLVAPGSISNMQALYIRGIGTSNPGFYPAVAVYVDDIFQPRPFGVGVFSLPDIERIEVLRGPQGTLYGQNSSAGALKFVSRTPSDTPVTTLSLGVGNDGYREASAYLAQPLKPGVLSAGLALASRRTDGYTYNATLDKQVDAVSFDQVRLKFHLTPSASTSATLTLDYGKDRSDNALYIPVGYPGAGPRVTFAEVDTQLDRTDQGAALHVEHAFNENLVLKSISGYREFEDDPSPWDQDGTPSPTDGWTQYIDQHQFSQEVQLNGDYGRLKFTTGLVYFSETLLFDRLTVSNGNYSELYSDLRSESKAVYGQVDYSITPALGITAGLRWSRDDQEFANDSYRNLASGERTAHLYSVSGLEDSWTSTTPKLALNYRWNADTLSYASVTRGSKIGGYNRAASTAPIASLAVGPEKVTAYEIGHKQRYLEGRAETSVAAFYNDFQDYQANVTNPMINGQYITGAVVVNAAQAHTYGIEFEGALRVTSNWDIKGSAAYLQTEFEDFQNPTGAANTDYSGNELPSAPDWTLGLSTVYRLPLNVAGLVTLDANARYIGRQESDIGNTQVIRIDPQTYVGAGVNYLSADGKWTFSLIAKNLLDKTYPVNLKYRAGVSNQAAYNPPRQLIFGVRYDY